MSETQTFPIGDWSCSAIDNEGTICEVWAVIEAELDNDFNVEFTLKDFEVTNDITKQDMFLVKDEEELKSFFKPEERWKIFKSAYEYCVLRFEQSNKPYSIG